MGLKCKCNDYLSYSKFKKQKELIGFSVSYNLDSEDCILCFFKFNFGTTIESELKEIMTKKIKNKYNVFCNCGCYYPYLENIKKSNKRGHAVAPIRNVNTCVNCLKISDYGTLDKEIIKEIKLKETIKRLNDKK